MCSNATPPYPKKAKVLEEIKCSVKQSYTNTPERHPKVKVDAL